METMTTKRIAFGFLALSLLACNFVTRLVNPATPTPLPTNTALASLDPTVAPLVPAYIPPECTSAPIATIAPDLTLAQPTVTLEPNEDISQGTQLGVFDDLVDVVDDVYVYTDFNGKDWEEIKTRYRSKVEAGLDTETFYREMQAMITELEDEHSYFLSPVEVAQSEAELRGENNYVGVGIYSLPDEDRQTFTVISTFPDSPAEHAGIKPHDKIIAVDGIPLTVDDNTSSRVRGPQCSAVVLTVQAPNEAPRDLLLIRAPITGNLNIVTKLIPTTDGSKIGYIFIPTFFDETIPPQIEEALNNFGPLDGLILDVRLNGGGSSSVVDPIFEHFVEGRLGAFVSRDSSRPLTVDSNPIHNSDTVPLIIIVSEDTVSYGEIFSGVLRDAGRAKIVGETSLGNVEVLHGYDFDDDSQVWIAAETFDSAFSAENWELTGIVPDVIAFAEWDTITFETDPSITAALQLLGHQ
jgi:carboxyl-terminal processing protease